MTDVAPHLPAVGSVWTGPGRSVRPPAAPFVRPPVTVTDAWVEDGHGPLVAMEDPMHPHRERVVPLDHFRQCFRPADETPTTDDLLRQYAAQLRALADEIDASLAGGSAA